MRGALNKKELPVDPRLSGIRAINENGPKECRGG